MVLIGRPKAGFTGQRVHDGDINTRCLHTPEPTPERSPSPPIPCVITNAVHVLRTPAFLPFTGFEGKPGHAVSVHRHKWLERDLQVWVGGRALLG